MEIHLLPNMHNQLHRPELLIPAGSLEKLKTAILYGADAVYCGLPDLSMRTKSTFTLDELTEGIAYAHSHGVQVYVTLNLYAHNKDIQKLPQFIGTLRKIRPDGVIIADPGVFQYVKDHAPELKLHISTQANITGWLSVQFWEKLGADLVVLAREVSYAEMKEIREKCPNIKLEQFVHGSMCMTYSGRCLLSNFLAERGANQGNCAHSCRWNYKLHMKLKDGTTEELLLTEENKDLFSFFLEEQFRPGELIPLEEDEQGAYILNSKDLCLMPRLPELIGIGIDSFKIEGRNKTNYYAAIVTRAYRMAIDDYIKDPDSWNVDTYMKELEAVQGRGYTLAFHDGRLTNLAHNYEHGGSQSYWENAGFIRAWDGEDIIFEVKNTLLAGELIEFLSPNTREPIRLRLQSFEDSETAEITEKVSPGQQKAIRIPSSIFRTIDPRNVLPILTVARKKKQLTLLERKQLRLEREEWKAEKEKTTVPPDRKLRLLANTQEQHLPATSEDAAYHKSPRLGSEGCCGKGCNGCLIFWYDPKYAAKKLELEQHWSPNTAVK